MRRESAVGPDRWSIFGEAPFDVGFGGAAGDVLGIRGGNDEAADVTEWLLGDCHLAEVIFPGIRLEPATGIRLALDVDDFSVLVEASVGGRGDDKGDLAAVLPEGAGEVVRKEQGQVMPPFGQVFHGGLFRRPDTADGTVVPGLQVEAVASGLLNHQSKQFRAGHGQVSRFRQETLTLLSKHTPECKPGG